MTDMRAKMVLTKVESYEIYATTEPTPEPTCETLHFRAVCKNDYSEDGSDENNTYSKFTPSAELQMSITNPALVGKFKTGDVFYLDFSQVFPVATQDEPDEV